MPRNLEQWLMHQGELHPRTIDLGLERLTRTLERLEWRQPDVPVITIAGTNGKGSVAAYCASILTCAGRRVGTFTSPHLSDYRERIRLGDRLVSEAELVAAFERIEAARTVTPEISLTFFEFNALAAFLCFAAAGVDAWVLEVGMGGRLDAVNVVDPTVAVVVSIGLDHQEFLGSTLEAIAVEKAGVFRAGRCAVIGSLDIPPALVESALVTGARPKRLGIEFRYEGGPATNWRYVGSRWDLAHLPAPGLAGGVQMANAATAIAALEELDDGMGVTIDAVARGLSDTRLVGRFQRLAPCDGKPAWILDVAHNPAAARVLAQNLRTQPHTGRTFAVCGILADKDAGSIAREVQGCIDSWWLASIDGARGTAASALAERIAGVVDAPVVLCDAVGSACAAAAAAAERSDRIVVFGSFQTVGPALDWLGAQGLLSPCAS